MSTGNIFFLSAPLSTINRRCTGCVEQTYDAYARQKYLPPYPSPTQSDTRATYTRQRVIHLSMHEKRHYTWQHDQYPHAIIIFVTDTEWDKARRGVRAPDRRTLTKILDMDFSTLVKVRQSDRRYKPQAVEADKIELCIEARHGSHPRPATRSRGASSLWMMRLCAPR